MARPSVSVSCSGPDYSRVPRALVESITLCADFAQRGVLEALGQKVHINRQGGYSGFDVWLVLFLYLSGGSGKGIRKFYEEILPLVQQVGALAGRKRLMSPASISRALDSVEESLIRPIASWLLLDLAEIDPVLRHPSALTYDATGDGWHVFHLDPTVTTLRQRGLPADDELPEARRRSAETGRPGHAGRKRGNLQFRRITVQHAGSGAWVHAHISKGNGEGVEDFELGLSHIVETCQRLGHPVSRAVAIFDGEYGNIPWYAACRKKGIPFITRLNRPKLLENPTILKLLRDATWSRVPSSLSGPERFAADLGRIEIAPGKNTRRKDGTRYNSVTIRIVATIFQTENAAKHGCLVDGYQVELFAVDLDPLAWPPEGAIGHYFGRGGQENRFAQEDRELVLDRIVSYSLPGQELASVIGLSIWNIRIAKGFALDTPPAKMPVQKLRRTAVSAPVPASWPRDPVVLRHLEGLDWTALLKGHPGWRFDAKTGELFCGEGRPLTLSSVRPLSDSAKRASLIFRRPSGGCEKCDVRDACFQSKQADSSKHIELSVPAEVGHALQKRLADTRTGGGRPPQRPGAPATKAQAPYEVLSALLLPAKARLRFAKVFMHAAIHIDSSTPARTPSPARLVAGSEAERQRRRCTWQQNLDRYALPPGVKVGLRVLGGEDLQAWFTKIAARPNSDDRKAA